jgi:hypothetical protein
MWIPSLITVGILGLLYATRNRGSSGASAVPDLSLIPVPDGSTPRPSGRTTPVEPEGPLGAYLADVHVKPGSVPFNRPFSADRAALDQDDLKREAQTIGLFNVDTRLDPEADAALYQHYTLKYSGPRERVQKLPSFLVGTITPNPIQ